jgi:PAS domain S-box-containing protein
MPGDGTVRGRARLDAAPFRLRFAAYAVVIAALPVAVGAWALGRQVSANEAQKADVMLQPELRGAAALFTMKYADARAAGERLAGDPRLVRALARHDRGAVSRVLRGHRYIAALLNRSDYVGDYPKRAATVPVDILAGNQTIGSLIVSIPIDEGLLRALREAGRVDPPDEIAVAGPTYAVGGPPGLVTFHATPGRPRDVTIGGATYRALGAKLEDMRLLVLRPRRAIDEAVSSAHQWIYGGAAGLLAAVALLAYFLAPLLARGRLTQQQRAQAARVLSEVGDGVFLLDRDGCIRLWNPAAEAITGLAGVDVVGQRIDAVMPAWGDISSRIAVGAPGANGNDRGRVSTVPVDFGGRELWLSFSGADFDEGRVYTFRDLSDDRRVEQLKMDFVATVSHELRTPLSAISGASLTLRERGERLPDATRGQLLAMISEQSDRLSILIDDILTAGQLAYGRLAVANEAFGPVELARSVVDEAGATLVEGHTLELHAAPDVARSAGDASKARQVLTNLLENATKYSPGGGRIDVRVEPAERGVRFSVTDEGLGIPKKEQERVFEKFYRVDPLMKQGISGTGLGLYICRELVQHMGGRIWVTSAPGVGSTFTFELPFAAREPRRRRVGGPSLRDAPEPQATARD